MGKYADDNSIENIPDVNNGVLTDDEVFDVPAEPDYAVEVDDEDLEWDLPDSGDAPELDEAEDAAWEAGTLALMDEPQDALEDPDREAYDAYRDHSGYPDDEMPEPADEIYTEELPILDELMDTSVVSLREEDLTAGDALEDTTSFDTASIEIIDAGIEEEVSVDTDVIPIISTEEIAGADALEILHKESGSLGDEHADSDRGENDENGAETGDMPAHGRRTALDYAIWVAGLVAAGLAVIAGLKYYNVMQVRAEAARYQTIGSALAGIGTIGEDQIAAIRTQREQRDADRKAAEQRAAEKAALAANEGTIPVTMTLSTVQSDLKIKIHGENKSLITDVPFKVEVTLPSGKTAEYEDDDQDGIIYQTGLSKGTYKVTMEQLVADAEDGTDITDTDEYKNYSQYRIPTDTQTISVTDQIAYKAVDVSDEIKSASQVNVAAEDTQQKMATESALKDTVEYVASTTTAEEDALYEVVDKADIVDPNVSARADLVIGNFRMLAEDADESASEAAAVSEDDEDDDDASGDDVEQVKRSYTTTIKGSTSVAEGGTTLITASTDEPGATTYTWELDGDAVSIDRTDGKTVTVTGRQEGTATLTVHAHLVADDAEPTENVVSVEITVTAAEETSNKRLSVSPGSITLAPGKTQALSVSLEGLEDHSVTYESSEPMIAEVLSDGTVTAHTVGETTVTVTANADSSLKQSVKVKVVETETNADGNALLKDKDGNQIYVKDNGAYREATAADYDAFDTFYRKAAGAAASGFKYTGWQNIGGKTYYFNSAGEPVTGNQVINGASYTFGSDGALTSGTSKVGIDVSQWNGSISWSQVAGSGISYAIVRCGYRGSSTGALIKDPNYTTNIAGATAAGLKVGIYVFSQAVNEVEAVEEASMAVSMAAGYGVSLPIFIDVEAAGGRADGLSTSQRTAIVSAFCQTVQASGYSAGIYSNTNWLTERVNTPALTSYHIWVAQYASSLAYSRTRYDIWQYSSKGRVAGISGDVDMNMSYRSY